MQLEGEAEDIVDTAQEVQAALHLRLNLEGEQWTGESGEDSTALQRTMH